MNEPVLIARASQVPDGEARVFAAGEREIALYHVGDDWYATENTCCHRGGPLGHGELDGTTITCPWHMWQFDVRSGACLNAPGEWVRTYRVVVQGEDLRVSLQAPSRDVKNDATGNGEPGLD